MEKEALIEALGKGLVVVTFTKKDGTERIMPCTRNLELIPEEFQPKSEEAKEAKEADSESDNIKVYDISVDGWRSFNYSTVINVGDYDG